jgi:hypothetical protein
MSEELFDYAPIMTKMERLLKEIHKNFLDGKPEENLPLIEELAVEARLLRVYTLGVVGK